MEDPGHSSSAGALEATSSDLPGEAFQQDGDDNDTNAATSVRPPTPPRGLPSFITSSKVTQQAINNHLAEIGALQTRVDEPGNTVLAIVKFPSDTDAGRACNGEQWRDMHLLMNYDKLKSLGSSRIDAMFSDRAQARIRRALGLTTLPPGVDYVLDFTPPSEGAELADLTAGLWLPRMVKLWFLAGHFIPDPVLTDVPPSYAPRGNRALADKAVGACLALGHDDLCRNVCCLLDHASWEISKTTPGIFETDDIPKFRQIDDYCPVRHRVSVMRVLRAINGHDLLLNSATRMWTVAQTAIHLEIPQIVLDPVTQWLIAPPNTKFIEICPERAFQLAYALKIPDVLITAFEILVSELAVDLAAPDPSTVRPARSWVGRRRDEYGDFPSDPVDYAARAFVERITSNVDLLLSNNVFDRLSLPIPEWRKLCEAGAYINALGRPGLKKAYNLLVEALPSVFHRRVDDARDSEFPVLERRIVPWDLLDAQTAHYVPPAERRSSLKYYADLDPAQKVMTPFFWRVLQNQKDYHTCVHATHNGRSIEGLSDHFEQLLKAEFSKGHLKIPGYSGFTYFNTQLFFSQLADAVSHFTKLVIGELRETKLPLYLSDHLLLNLAEKELDFLPIWAGGLDDGTGGVFQELVPEAEMGPSEPGPGYHTGYTVATDTSTLDGTSTIAPSDLGMGNLDIESVTQARSVVAEQSATTGPDRGVVASINDSSDDRFSVVNDAEYADAMFNQPAGHQAHGQALVDYVEDDGESTAPSFTVDGETVSEVSTQSQQPQQSTTATLSNENGDDFDMLDTGEDELDLSDGDSESTLGESDYDMV
ncbi:hypothetical protein V8F20_002559 [Naviculisporaceae sp. PSN 640]